MTLKTFYKTSDGKIFEDKSEALTHMNEENIKLRSNEKDSAKVELDKLHEKMNGELDKAVDAYKSYSDVFSEYSKKKKEFCNKYPEEELEKDELDELEQLLDGIFSLFR